LHTIILQKQHHHGNCGVRDFDFSIYNLGIDFSPELL